MRLRPAETSTVLLLINDAVRPRIYTRDDAIPERINRPRDDIRGGAVKILFIHASALYATILYYRSACYDINPFRYIAYTPRSSNASRQQCAGCVRDGYTVAIHGAQNKAAACARYVLSTSQPAT